MKKTRLDMDTTGVLFFDMVNYGRRNAANAPADRKEASDRAMANAVRIMSAARKRGMELFYTQPDHRTDNRDFPPRIADFGQDGSPKADPEEYQHIPPRSYGGTWEAQVVDELAPEPKDTVILKHRWSPFHQTHLELSLRTAGVNTLAVLGGALEAGVASTAYSARDYDISLIFIQDAITAVNPAALKMFMELVFPRFGLVRSTEWFVQKLQE